MSPAVIWFLTGVVLFLSELFSPLFVLFFFGIGAWTAGLAALLGASLSTAIMVFCVVSVVSLLLLRRFLVRTFTGRSRMAADVTDDSASIHTGKLCTVSRAVVPPQQGEVSLGGSYWRAESTSPLKEGDTVRVLGHVSGDELILRVEPASTAAEEK